MGKKKEKKTSVKSSAPMIIIGVALFVAIFGGWYYLSTAKQGPVSNSASNSASTRATPAKTNSIPPNAPPGATPPNQSGSPAALVTLEEFADYQCSACAVAHPTLNEIKAEYGSRIRFVFRNFPLSIPAHDKAYDAAVAAEAAGMQGKFWEMQNLLFNNQHLWTSSPNYKQLWKEYATRIGLNIEKWENDMLGIPAKSRVDEDLKRGRAIGVNATPTVYVNGTSVGFAEMNVSGLKKLIDAELQKAPSQAQPAVNEAPAQPAGSN